MSDSTAYVLPSLDNPITDYMNGLFDDEQLTAQLTEPRLVSPAKTEGILILTIGNMKLAVFASQINSVHEFDNRLIFFADQAGHFFGKAIINHTKVNVIKTSI